MFKSKSPQEKYKTGAELTRTSKNIRGRIRWRGEASQLTGHTRRVLFVVIGKKHYCCWMREMQNSNRRRKTIIWGIEDLLKILIIDKCLAIKMYGKKYKTNNISICKTSEMQNSQILYYVNTTRTRILYLIWQ